MNKEVGEEYGLKHGFIINHWAAPDILPLCVRPIPRSAMSARATGRFLWGAFSSPLASPSRLGRGSPDMLGDSGRKQSSSVLPVKRPIP